MLTEIKIANYRCFDGEEQRVCLAPLTVLTGANGAGKSTVLDAVRAMSPMMDADRPFRGFVPHPADVPDKTDWHKLDPTRVASIELFASAFDSNLSDAEFPRRVADLANILRHPVGWRIEVGALPRRIIHALTFGGSTGGLGVTVSQVGAAAPDLPTPPATLLLDGRQWVAECSYPGMTHPCRQAFDLSIAPAKVDLADMVAALPAAQTRLKLVQRLAATALAAFAKVRFLSSTRGHLPPDAVMGDPPKSVGSSGESLLQFLASVDRTERETEWNWMTRWLEPFGVSSFVTRAIGVNKVSASFRDAKTSTSLPGPRASSGFRQILPVILELAFAPPGTCILVEEPELSVHPLAQQSLAKMLLEAVADKKQVVATTHSPYLLEALSAEARARKLDARTLAAYEVARSDTGASRVAEIDLLDAKAGQDWPRSWREAEQHVVDHYTRESGA